MGFMDTLFGKKPRTPQLKELELKSMSDLSSEFAGQMQGQNWDNYVNSADTMNADFLNRLNSFLGTDLSSQVSGVADMYGSMAKGEIPKDVADQIARQTAAQGISGGYGATSQMGRNLTARDLGLTSMQVSQQGLQGLGNLTNYAKQLNPYSASNFIFSPQQIQARNDQQSLYNNQIQNQQEQLNAAASGKSGIFGTLMSAAGGIAGGIFGGPMGAQIGMQAGSALGGVTSSAFGGYESPQQSQMMGNLAGAFSPLSAMQLSAMQQAGQGGYSTGNILGNWALRSGGASLGGTNPNSVPWAPAYYGN